MTDFVFPTALSAASPTKSMASPRSDLAKLTRSSPLKRPSVCTVATPAFAEELIATTTSAAERTSPRLILDSNVCV